MAPRSGQDRTGGVRTGQSGGGQDRTGQGRSGQDRKGQDRQDRTGAGRLPALPCLPLFLLTVAGVWSLGLFLWNRIVLHKKGAWGDFIILLGLLMCAGGL